MLVVSLVFVCSSCDFVDLLIEQGYTKPTTDFSDDETIIESYQELNEIIASISDNFIVSKKVRLRNIGIWNDLDKYYTENPEALSLLGVSGLEIVSSATAGGFLNAEIFPQYEMFMKVLIAVETGNKSRLTSQEQKIYTRAREILKYNVKGTSTFDKVFSIHNYLTETIMYDENHANNDNAFNVYGALIEGKTVCKGYAHAFQMLSHMAGIDSRIIVGFAGGESHAWNLVNFGSERTPEWYHIDVTWNDKENTRSYRFFNVSDNIMNLTHNWNSAFYPKANGVKYNYFRYKGIMASSLQNLESKFAQLYTAGESYYEVLCAFPLSSDDLGFLYNYQIGNSDIMISIEHYDNSGVLLSVYL